METKFPSGWDEARVRGVLDHYERQSEDEAVTEDEAAGSDHSPAQSESIGSA